MPAIRVIVYPTPVQGEGAGAKIAQTLCAAAARAECDLLIVCRGGGSIEDLWAYNEEVLARAIHACPIPVVAGVGHETDVTIADFVADARAPTPTAAAELASPDSAKLKRELEQWRRQFARHFLRGLEERMQRLDYLTKRLVHPGERIRVRRTELAHMASRLRSAWQHARQERMWETREWVQRLAGARPDLAGFSQGLATIGQRLREASRRRMDAAAQALARADAHLRHLSPQQVLERGYSITTAAGGIVRDAGRLAVRDEVMITFARGSALAEVKSKKNRDQ